MANGYFTYDDLVGLAKVLREDVCPRPGMPLTLMMPRQMMLEFKDDFNRRNTPTTDAAMAMAYGLSEYGVKSMETTPREEFDWSGCRSPSRAKRRHFQGHKQRVVIKRTNVAYLLDEAALDLGMRFDRMALKVLRGE